MKTTSFLLTIVSFLTLTQISIAQENWSFYGKSVDITNYQGLPFHMQASVRTNIVDEDAAARLVVRVDKKIGIGFFENMWLKPIRNKDWKTYTIDGVIDTGAYRIVVGAMCQFNGKFYLDNIKLDVKTAKNRWKNIYLEDFESPKDSVHKYLSGGKNPFFTTEVQSDALSKKNHCFVITGNGVPNFGTNKAAGKYANVNGVRIYYEIYGEGQPLIILHPNGASIEAASLVYPDLMKKYKIIALDSRAQGKSTDTDQPLTYEQMAMDVNALMDELQVDSAFIWGHSDGAIIGLILAMDYPKKVKKLLALGANIQPDSTAIFPYFIDYVQKEYKKTEAAEKKLNRLMLDYPQIPFTRLSRIKAPVLIMAGDRDVIRPEHTLKLFQNIPNAQLCIIPGSTHWPSYYNHELFLTLLFDFFDKPFSMPDSKDHFF